MKPVITISRILVGLLFIFSGLVKANDPLGLSYKMQEFFELWGMTKFNSWTLLMSVLMNAFEIIAGFALLLGWRIKLFSWLLLLLIIFFTFLTGYAYLSGKFKNCGCFGDCLPITPMTSFLKDLLLLFLIIFLFAKRNLIKSLFPEKATTFLMLGITVLSFGIQWYTLTYLPIVDCLPFKKGKNIAEQMKRPANAIPDSTVITFIYEKDGKQVEFTADKFPPDFNSKTYHLVKRYDRIVRKGSNNEPPIKGFALSGSRYKDDTLIGVERTTDSTEIVLSQPYAILLFCENISTPVSKWKNSFGKIYTAAAQKNIPVYVITTARDTAIKVFAKAGFPGIQVFNCDYTAIRTAARTNPCMYLLNKGTIIDKQSYKRMDKILGEIKSIATQQSRLSSGQAQQPAYAKASTDKPTTSNPPALKLRRINQQQETSN